MCVFVVGQDGMIANKAGFLESISCHMAVSAFTSVAGYAGPSSSLDLRRGYEAPFLERAGRLPLGQASKREEAGLP